MSDKALILKPIVESKEILTSLRSGQLLSVNGTRGNALIVCHTHYAEIAGPGAAVGRFFDLDCHRIIPIGSVSLIYPESGSKRQQAYATRKNWIDLMQKITSSPVPLQRSQTLLKFLHKYFPADAIAQLPDEILAQLVGVLPKTIEIVRHSFVSQPQSQPVTTLQ